MCASSHPTSRGRASSACGNVLVHGYFDIDADIVWEAARRDVPALWSALQRLLQELEDRER
jgi:uncharacterized protein with HEPN domain